MAPHLVTLGTQIIDIWVAVAPIKCSESIVNIMCSLHCAFRGEEHKTDDFVCPGQGDFTRGKSGNGLAREGII